MLLTGNLWHDNDHSAGSLESAIRCRVVAACSRLAVIHVTFTTRSEKVEASTWAVARIGETIPVRYLNLQSECVLINGLIIKSFFIYKIDY